MHLSVKEVAHILKVSERTVRNYIASGKLLAERRGRQILIPKTELRDLGNAPLESPDRSAPDQGNSAEVFPGDESYQSVLEHLCLMEHEIHTVLNLLRENQLLASDIRQMEKELARKDLEISKLQRDLAYQKRLHEKEIEDLQQILQEKWDLLEKQAQERAIQEKDHFENRLALERNNWSERLAQEQAEYVQKLDQARNQEGFWSRLIKMMTWS